MALLSCHEMQIPTGKQMAAMERLTAIGPTAKHLAAIERLTMGPTAKQLAAVERLTMPPTAKQLAVVERLAMGATAKHLAAMESLMATGPAANGTVARAMERVTEDAALARAARALAAQDSLVQAMDRLTAKSPAVTEALAHAVESRGDGGVMPSTADGSSSGSAGTSSVSVTAIVARIHLLFAVVVVYLATFTEDEIPPEIQAYAMFLGAVQSWLMTRADDGQHKEPLVSSSDC